MKQKIRVLAGLFVVMLKIGLFTFGGGYAMIALLEHEFIEKKKWITKDEFLNMSAIAGSAPGSIAINAATYMGYSICGIWGSLIATIAVCIPSFTIIYLISLFLDAFLSIKYIAYAFRGIQVCVIYLIIRAGIKMFKDIKHNFFNIFIFSSVVIFLTLMTLFSVNFSSVIYILICGILGISVFFIKEKIKLGGKKK